MRDTPWPTSPDRRPAQGPVAMTCLHLPVAGMVSPLSEQAIEASLSRLPGVNACASFAGKCVKVEFDRRNCAVADIVDRLDRLGVRVMSPQKAAAPRLAEPAGPRPTPTRWLRLTRDYPKLVLAGFGALMLLGAWLTHLSGGPASLRIGLAVACYILCGWYTAQNTLKTLRLLQFDIDLLMFVAAAGAATIGHWEEGGMLLLLFALGTAGEEMAMDKARQAIHALARLAPDTATRRKPDGHEEVVPVEDLQVGDCVVVRPFDRLPADGMVRTGVSNVDQAPITGESVPVEKSPGSNVFAGTINGEGLLVVHVSKCSAESTLAKVVRLVAEAQASKSPTQLFTAKIERYYVPLVLAATLLLIFIPLLLAGQGWATWFYRSMAFLTAASPCALAIGTPAAVLSGIGRAAQIGVLIKGGVHLENLGRVRAVALDKTGTLTRGRPAVTGVTLAPDTSCSPDELLTLAAAVEQSSRHPLARAIVDEAKARGLTPASVDQVEQVPAQGMVATVDGRSVRVGKPSWAFGEESVPGAAAATEDTSSAWIRRAGANRSVVAVAVDGRPAGLVALADEPRASATTAVRRLRHLGITRVIMLTGDNQSVANTIARAVGIDEVHAALLPQDKSRLIINLQSQAGPIAMVGDGVNDAPAMALASVGVAMGGAATDVALEAADVAILGDDLLRLPDAIGLSRASRRITAQNLFIALGVIALVAPLAAAGVTPLGLAVLLHEGSTVVVVLNALRLLRWTAAADDGGSGVTD